MQLKDLVEELEKVDTDIYRRVRCVNGTVIKGSDAMDIIKSIWY